jgi:hypothetical protein
MALEGESEAWPEQLAQVAALGFDTVLVGVPDDGELDFVRRPGEEAAPTAREALG